MGRPISLLEDRRRAWEAEPRASCHAPFRPDRVPLESVQNTDPMVFGDAFIYSNCLQAAYVSLRTLTEGSIVLFGRHSKVGGSRVQPRHMPGRSSASKRSRRTRSMQRAYGEDILADAVLNPLYTEGAVDAFTVYFGRVRAAGDARHSASFRRARSMTPDPHFARPRLAADWTAQGGDQS